ncbi:hypothetical protein [Lysobacter gummosus]|uniref:hypothetical protein n=1 Tax=Lysobacter gummosus TaxID=262324 RepID=UPI00363EAFC3
MRPASAIRISNPTSPPPLPPWSPPCSITWVSPFPTCAAATTSTCARWRRWATAW